MPGDVERKLAAILSADVVGYSRLMAEDEDETVHGIAESEQRIRELAREHGGRVVDFTGDNFLAEFATTVRAMECALEIQREHAPERRIRWRIGLHVGDVRIEGERIFGSGINVAARLEPLAETGGICVSGVVREQLRGTLDLDYEDLGKQDIKNVPDPVHAFRVICEASAQTLAAGLPGSERRAQVSGRPAIAVLPFDNLSSDPAQEYFADGIAEDLITRLSSWAFPVVARTSSFAYKGQRVPVDQVSRELGARYVVEGSVQRSHERVRVTVQLIDGQTSHHVWAKRFDRKFEDALAVQDEIVGSIVRSMWQGLDLAERQRAAKREPTSVTAWDLYLRGLWHASRMTKADIRLARVCYTHALEIDPSMIEALLNLVASHYADIMNGWAEDLEVSLAEMRRIIRECVDLDPLHAGSLIAMGLYCSTVGDTDGAIRAYERAVELRPEVPDTHRWLGVGLTSAGRYEDAIRALSLALELGAAEPEPSLAVALAWAHFGAGRYDEAVAWARRTLLRRPGDTLAFGVLAASLGLMGRDAEAKAAADELPEFSEGGLRGALIGTDPALVNRVLEGLRRAGWQG